jgi:hypothetical protein
MAFQPQQRVSGRPYEEQQLGVVQDDAEDKQEYDDPEVRSA